MTAASAALGVALHGVMSTSQVAPLLGGLFGIAIGAALGYGKPIVRLAAAALASMPLLFMTTKPAALALCAGILALGTIGGRGLRGLAITLLGATVTLLAMWTALRFDHARVTATWSPWVTAGASSAAMGIVAVIAMLPRHLSLEIDPVKRAIARLPATLDSYVRSGGGSGAEGSGALLALAPTGMAPENGDCRALRSSISMASHPSIRERLAANACSARKTGRLSRRLVRAWHWRRLSSELA